jgi:hypothetical protein
MCNNIVGTCGPWYIISQWSRKRGFIVFLVHKVKVDNAKSWKNRLGMWECLVLQKLFIQCAVLLSTSCIEDGWPSLWDSFYPSQPHPPTSSQVCLAYRSQHPAFWLSRIEESMLCLLSSVAASLLILYRRCLPIGILLFEMIACSSYLTFTFCLIFPSSTRGGPKIPN